MKPKLNKKAKSAKRAQRLLDSPLPRVPWGVRDVIKVLIITWFVPAILVIAMLLLGKYGILPNGFYSYLKHNAAGLGIILQLCTVTVEVAMLAIILRLRQARLGDFGLRAFSWWRAILYIIGLLFGFTLAVAFVFALLIWLVPSFNADEAQSVGFEYGKAGVGLWLSAFFTVIVAPFIEELYFRGFILPALAQRWGIFVGVLGSSLLFAILHFQTNVIIYTFILGLVLCWLYIRTRSIIPGIILHIINNAIAFAVLAGLIR